MNSKTLIVVVVSLVVLLGLGFLIVQNQSKKAEAPTETIALPTENTLPTPVSDITEANSSPAISSEVKEFTVESNGLKFTPNTITVKMGDKVKVTYKNNLGKHDWNLDEFSAKTELINAGESQVVEFVADKAGEYEFYCSVPGHRQAGMKGKFVVTE